MEVPDESAAEKLSEKEKTGVLEREAKKLLLKMGEGDYPIALDVAGKEYTSEQWAGFLEERMNGGDSRLCFIIGGSLGLGDPVLSRTKDRVSFSKMTFPHQLMRVILLEQIYRAFKILRNEPYHK